MKILGNIVLSILAFIGCFAVLGVVVNAVDDPSPAPPDTGEAAASAMVEAIAESINERAPADVSEGATITRAEADGATLVKYMDVDGRVEGQRDRVLSIMERSATKVYCSADDTMTDMRNNGISQRMVVTGRNGGGIEFEVTPSDCR